ncbi:hypothetical protein SASPL_132625 [Salvia splendens]|uniref:Uncharacterized protein n=1 Tax=Salvia splendens TaxID=180675 RepID=A0A8X8ZHP2_SALSN|nr:hypothetical protein SASPL_132625 [Salvia splendens]
MTLKDAAAEKKDWPPLYDVATLKNNKVVCCYFEDMDVKFKLVTETTPQIAGIRLWITITYSKGKSLYFYLIRRKMQRTVAHSRLLARPLLTAARAFSTSPSGEKIVASVLFERLPVVIPKIDPVVYAFHEFSFRWQQQYRKEYPDSFLQKSNARYVVCNQASSANASGR